MGIKMVVLVLVLVLCSFNDCVKCTRHHLSSTSEQTMEIEKNLIKHSNNQSVKTLEYFGDVYDCVEFLKQPAFSNPLLKNHAYHNYQADINSKSYHTSDDMYKSIGAIGLPDGGCPMGTVPIWRPKKEDLSYNKQMNITSLSDQISKYHRAVVRTRKNPNNKYFGSTSLMSLHRPKVFPNQNSFGLMCLGNGPENIEVGWMVNPIVSARKDTQPRLYAYTNSGSSSCFNSECGQFVQTNPKIPLGAILTPVSGNGQIYELTYLVSQEASSGVWKLYIGKGVTEIGFWPRQQFKNLDKFATYVEWGGDAKTVPGESGPPMGTGLFPGRNERTHAYMKVNVNNNHHIETRVAAYEIYDDASLYKAAIYDSHYVEYGGPGRK